MLFNKCHPRLDALGLGGLGDTKRNKRGIDAAELSVLEATIAALYFIVDMQ